MILKALTCIKVITSKHLQKARLVDNNFVEKRIKRMLQNTTRPKKTMMKRSSRAIRSHWGRRKTRLSLGEGHFRISREPPRATILQVITPRQILVVAISSTKVVQPSITRVASKALVVSCRQVMQLSRSSSSLWDRTINIWRRIPHSWASFRRCHASDCKSHSVNCPQMKSIYLIIMLISIKES